MTLPATVTVYAVSNGDGSVSLFRDPEKTCKLVYYPPGCADTPSRKYTLSVKLPTSCRWALKWLN